jgi:hypothetical protein
MKKLYLIFCPIIFLLFVSGSADRKNSPSGLPQTSGDMVVFHEHTNYGGQQLSFSGTDVDIPKFSAYKLGSGNWNDKISSIMIGKNRCLTVWKDANYKGSKYTFQPSSGSDKHVYRLPDGWGDKISSAKIRPRTNCAK